MKEVDRREFIKGAGAIVLGIAANEVIHPIELLAMTTVYDKTGIISGSAAAVEKMQDMCGESDDLSECYKPIEYSSFEKTFHTVITPPIEELIFRACPSYVMNTNQENYNDHYEELQNSRTELTTKAEIKAGLASSAIYGFLHNITNKGVNTKVIPLPQMMNGMMYWYLQRKVGFLSNTAAHIWNNVRSLGIVK